MRKAFVSVLALIVMLSLPPFGAEAGRWRRDGVPFYDFTFSRMESTVHEWNAVRQPGQPTLRYIPKAGQTCDRVKRKERIPDFGIYACSENGFTGNLGVTIYRNVQHGEFRLIQIKIFEQAHSGLPWQELDNTQCHEGGHALGLNHPPLYGPRSCLDDLEPLLLAPGQWDIDTLRDLYGRSAKKGKKGKK